jgi:hypothetical protein
MVTFDFKGKLCGLPPYPPLPSPENIQALANYKSFGNSLRLFLLKSTTIPATTCPETALQLLSLRKDSDGFNILQNLVFLHSPQLQGKFKDFCSLIGALHIIPGEHIREFYSRTEILSQEIELAQLEDGSNAALSERFLSLLRNTNDPLIIGETSHAWKAIQSFRRDPKHLRKPLPWTYNDILRDLELASVTTLASSLPTSSTTDLIDAHVAFGSQTQRPLRTRQANSRHNTPAIPTTSNGRHLISSPTSSSLIIQPHCKLCNNGHPNPWHTEANCPFKDPTHILCKTTRENVMQHNSLYGAINKNFSKSQDTSSTTQRVPTPPILPNTRKSPPTVRFATGATTTTTDNPDPTSETPLTIPIPEDPSNDDIISTPSPTYLPFDTTDDYYDETIHTEYFDLPVPPMANVCTGFTAANPTFEENTAFSDLILDPMQYLSFSA